MTPTVARDDVVAFRLASHGLSERSPRGALLDVAGSCGIQNSPPGAGQLALSARVSDLTPGDVEDAIAQDKSLLQTWSLRGAPHYLPTAEAAVFTTGVLPPTEEAMRHFVLGVGDAVDELGMSLTEAVELTGAEIREVLGGRRPAIGELGAEIAERIAPGLAPSQRAVWEQEGPYAAGQPLGEGVVHFCIRILTLQQVVCFAPREGNKAPFVLVDEWLDDPIPQLDPDRARAELLRRYLHCFGPSTRADFASWLGVRTGDVGPWWDLVAAEMTQVDHGGAAWILTDDLEALDASPRPTGVRLLPPRDPYLQQRDRSTILAPEHHRAVFRPVGEPGTVLAHGEIVGIWRPRKRGRRLTLTIEPFAALTAQDEAALASEAEQVAMMRGASSVDLRVDRP